LIGGATISFGYLIDYLDRSNKLFQVINTQYFSKGFKRVFNPFFVLGSVLFYAPSADVVFLNSSRGGTKYLVPILMLIANLFSLKFVFRPFGGDIKDYTAQYSIFWKWLFRKTTLKSDILFLQTKELMQYYANQNANTIQFPTSREMPTNDLIRAHRPYEKRFIYLGFINESKGIDQILESISSLDETYTIHIYGPIKEHKYHQLFAKHPGVYQGVLPKEKVLKCLREYDVLLLPTCYEGEGYPGAIIEAYSVGLPVITTNWKAIPEIVKREETGLLIEPLSTTQLIAAIKYFDTCDYEKYSKNVRRYFEQNFSSDQVIGQAFKAIDDLFTKDSSIITQEKTSTDLMANE